MRKVLNLLFIVISFYACQTEEPECFIVSGKIKDANGEKIYLIELKSNGINVLDSTILDDTGDFLFKGQTDIPKFYSLKAGNNNYLTLIIDNLDRIQVETHINNLWKNAKIEGSKASKEILYLRHQLENSIKQLDSLARFYKSQIGKRRYYKVKDSLNVVSENIIKTHTDFSKRFVKRNSNSLAGLMALYQQIAPRRYVLTLKNDFEYFNLIDTSLSRQYPKSDAVRKLHSQIVQFQESKKDQETEVLNVGVVAPDIKLPNPKGDTLVLSALRGKYVLVDFWASWSDPCCSENKFLMQVYDKYKAKGFEVFQISLDRTKKSWIKAIEKDQLPWLQVSDLLFWDSKAAKKYNVQKIPANFLLDKKGKIIAKDLRGDFLEAKLSEIFN